MKSLWTRLCGLLCAAFLAVAFLAAAPAHAVEQALIDAAKKEGKVVWYVSLVENQLARPLAAAFEKKYPGIQVQIVPGTATDLVIKLLGETKAGQIRGDVHHGGSSVWPLAKAGAIEKYMPEAAKAYPPELKDPNGLWVADALYYLVAAVNTELVPAGSEPKTYQDLLDPKWKGKIAWTTQMTQGGAAGFIGTVLQAMGQEKGMAFLKQLAAQKLVNVPSNQRVVLDQVIAGEYPLALATFNYHSDISAAKGAPVKWLKLEPVTGTLDTAFLLKGPNPNAGKLFLEFILSEDGQKVVANAGYLPAHPAVQAKVAAQKPEGGNYKALLLSPELVESDLQKWISVYNELFK
ncbi:extracellular solute-binding protein [Bosea sp. BK604]|uniref:ABC transporter substrate-binding protein n=1 Tax=Bosea sp. BK604 TaxID=2512180 RepID=UPI00104D469F|nr:extracellular solute-binding protein [Bosea sp. BK604]TCR70648.1 iron(III) transport system substrate-binding protein [Bosea sp. BK604]